MSAKNVPVTRLHAEHVKWVKDLSFFRDELNIFRKQLTEIAARNTGSEVMAWTEHFENQFLTYTTLIDEMKHDIHEHEVAIYKNIEKKTTNHQLMADHAEFRGKFRVFSRVMQGVRQDFHKFLEKVS